MTCLVPWFSLLVPIGHHLHIGPQVSIEAQVAPVFKVIGGVVGDPLVVHVGNVSSAQPGILDTYIRRMDGAVNSLKSLQSNFKQSEV